jgi:MFS family permease
MNRQVAAGVLGNRVLARVELAFGAFNLADWVRWISIVVFAFDRGGAAEAGLISLVQSVAAAGVAPFAATMGDRWSRSGALLVGYLAQAIALAATSAALLMGAPALLVYAFAVLASMTTSVTRPAHASLLPDVTRTPEELTAANVVSSWMEGIGTLVGPAAGGVLLDLSSPGVVFGLAAALVTAGAAMVLRLGISRVAVRPPAESAGVAVRDGTPIAPEPASRAILGGFVALRRLAGPRLVVLVFAAAAAFGGAINVLYVTLALDVMHVGASGVGTLGGALGLGALVGATLATSLVGRPRIAVAIGVALLLFGLPIVAVAAVPVLPVAFALFVAAGAGKSIVGVAGLTLLQRASPGRFLSRILGVVESSFLAAFGVGSGIVAWLVVAVGPLAATAAAGLWLPFVAVLAWRRLRAIDARVVVPAEALALLRAIPIFAPLAAPVAERLARSARMTEFATGTTIIRQGDVGEDFYVIAEGEVEFSIDGEVVGDGTPGAFFGEIALLRNVPRTATVTALSPVRTYVLARDPFLAALTGTAPARDAAQRVAAARLGD